MNNFYPIFSGLKSFFEHMIQAMQSVFFWLLAIVAYMIGYPAQNGILIFALALFVLDIVSKFNTIRVQNKGLYNAFINGKISSRSFWDGFITKIIGYFIILTMGNLANITPQLSYIGKGVSSVLYLGLAFYEIISNLENLRDASFLAVIPILNKLKKEQERFFETKVEDITKKTQTNITETIKTSTTNTTINNNIDG